jgi:hypothetical protein
MLPLVQVTAALASTAKYDDAADGPLLELEKSGVELMGDAGSLYAAESSANVTSTPAYMGRLRVYIGGPPWVLVLRLTVLRSGSSACAWP